VVGGGNGGTSCGTEDLFWVKIGRESGLLVWKYCLIVQSEGVRWCLSDV
jgi:hypothetical protein